MTAPGTCTRAQQNKEPPERFGRIIAISHFFVNAEKMAEAMGENDFRDTGFAMQGMGMIYCPAERVCRFVHALPQTENDKE